MTEALTGAPGEIVHLYGTGFGPVSPAIATGVAASLTIGVYQADLLLPASLSGADYSIRCELPGWGDQRFSSAEAF